MKRAIQVLLLIFGASVLLIGCGATGSSYEVTVVNSTTSFNIDDLNISDSDQDTWGDDQLPPDTSIDPGEEVVLEDVGPISTPESVDVRATDRIYDAELTGTGLDITKTIYVKDSGVTN